MFLTNFYIHEYFWINFNLWNTPHYNLFLIICASKCSLEAGSRKSPIFPMRYMDSLYFIFDKTAENTQFKGKPLIFQNLLGNYISWPQIRTQRSKTIENCLTYDLTLRVKVKLYLTSLYYNQYFCKSACIHLVTISCC